MIWQTVPHGWDIYFTDSLKGNRITKYESEMAEMERLVANHYKAPEFGNTNFETVIGNSIKITDTNSVLSKWQVSSDSKVSLNKSGNDLYITANEVGSTNIALTKKDIKYSVDLLQNFLNLINEKMFDIKKSGNTKIYIEMFLLKFVDDYILNTNSTMIKVSNDVNNHINKTNNGIMKPKIKSDNNSNPIFDKTVGLNSDFNEKKIDNSNASLNDNGNNYMDDKNDDDYDNNDLVSIPKITNIDEIMKVRVNNTLAKADKNLLRLEMKNFTLLNDYTFDQEIGYLVCAILDAKLRVVSNDCLVLSYDYDSNARQNLNNLEKITDVYNKITNSNKNIAIITDEYWEKVKNEYILNIKNNVKYEVVEEPEPIFEELKNNDIITSSAVELFGDIVEVE